MSTGFDPAIAEWLRRRDADPTAADPTVEGVRRHSLAVNERSLALLPDPPVPFAEHAAVLDTASGPVPVLVVEPAPRPAASAVAFFHGGGWIAGDLRTHRQHMRRLAVEAGTAVIGVDYRLAPGHPFPAAFDDCLAATLHLAETRPGPLAVAGDSAGGQLAASVALACRDRGVELAGQLLVVPVTDVTGGYADPDVNALYPSRAERAEGHGLTMAGMRWFAELYRPPGRGDDRRVSPLRAADLSGVAPAAVHTAGFDPLRDEGDAYAAALSAAGVPVVHREWPTLNHGFFGLGGVSATAGRAARQAAADLRALLSAR
ncbi:alpha/beta hydrolase [Actinomadura verrucosospora]|uniref:Putative alpha/beta hydrolase R526 n=1 Tax=Actinomadura verrucosospora TaxID=46165 RepID=A0A7D3ZL26_ACTVE|nr:alpha/beta hydrolase [Actinomadura verrucosospora]QKG21022.1 putative alpha/beta hydrolase R526 [Actinomadura verrucosospora]